MLDLTSHRACQLAFSDGHTHDFTLFKESIGYSLPQNTLVFVDLGYLGILKSVSYTHLTLPTKA